MREHPIPQDITGYKFHIIGSMTLKQFLEIAIGVIVGGIIYASNLPGAVKFPLILVAVGLGAMAAFLPIEERPLDHWITVFIRSMYKPTQFFWKREPHIPEIFSFTPNLNTTVQEDEVNLGPVKKERIREYMTSVPSTTDPYAFDADEVSRMSAILGSFSSVTTSKTTITSAQIAQKPQLGVRVRNFRPQHQEQVVYENQTTATQATAVPTGARVVEEQVGANADLTEMYAERQQLSKQQKSADQVATEISIPETENIHIVDPATLAQQEENQSAAMVQSANNMTFMEKTEDGTGSDTKATEAAAFNVNLPFPEAPTEPNKLVGMVLTKANDLVTNAIVEVLKADGTVARAVKTNALGQFFITTPLANGNYTLEIDKDGLTFEPLTLSLDGTVVKPIEIRSLS